ncbi:MAG TPA: leishmanolysin-related zinc metalloendopeptidase [Gemmatimonadales bacterium]|nr:leishmanolysin-related zinc metalloendopeptidase [Gemmatimonadales bacterium]
MRTFALPAVSYAVAAAAAVVLAACKGSTEPVRVPTTVTIEPVGSTLASIGQQVSLRARLFDQFGDSLTGTFTWTSSAPGVVGVASTGTTTATVTSISNGTAIITATSGTASGSTAFTVQQTPTQIVIVGGNGQGGTPGQVLPAPLVARVSDGLGAPVPGAVVAFSVLAGGGSVSQAMDTTDTNGQASVTWTMGTDEGRVRAAVQGTGIGVEFVATINDETRFNISLRNTGAPLSSLVQLAFDEAKTRWQELIVGDLTAVQLNIGSGQCGSASPAINETVDDVVILVTIESIDGPGGVLGSAGPCFIRSTSRLTILGRMRFDQDDMDNLATSGRLNDVILHEMGHVLGFGTLWTQPQFNCLQNPSSAGPPVSSFDTHFSCANAVARFPEVGGSTYTGGQPVPVENCAGLSGCGAGSINSHWRELAFDNELMTGFLDAGVANPLSVVTVAAMADIGYLVNYGAASEYFHVFTAPGRLRERISLGDDVDRLPIYIYDERRGRIVGVHRP